MQWYAGSMHTVNAGINAIRHAIRPGEVSASKDAAGTSIIFTSVDGRDIKLEEDIAVGTGGTGGVGIQNTVADSTAVETRGKVTLSASENVTLAGTQEADLGFANDEVVTKDTTTLSSVNVLTVDAANTAMKRVDSSLTIVSNLRSTFGAIQNRFESTINNLQAVAENLTASRSRIQDADFAAETAALTRAQILQQAGVAILAQANAVPQNVLSLLR